MKVLVILIIIMFAELSMKPEGFLATQLKFPRVREAYDQKIGSIESMLQDRNLKTNDFRILMIAYKDEDVLEVYASPKNTAEFHLLKSYEICARSGELGPKRMQGDGQVPEGFYHINHFNPASNFHLSLGLNYPNAADKIKTTAKDPGGSIYIHGSCVTIGCLPMTDDKIREIYILAALAKNNGQDKIPVYIYPFRMTEENFNKYAGEYASQRQLLAFWSNLRTGYDKFTENRQILKYSIDKNGDYCF